MKRIVILVSILLTVLAVAQAQKPVYYDTFNQKWLDPAKWLAIGPGCDWGPTLECVKEIQNGRLRLETREMGATDSDSGFQYASEQVYFPNPNAINSITVDVALGRVNVVGCSTNPDPQFTRTVVKVAGTFFNTGSGDPADDISNEVYFWIDSSNPKTMSVGNWGTWGGPNMGSYPIGTPLTVTNAWDKANHQFIVVVKVTGDDGSGTKVVVPYSVSDTTPPVNPYKVFTNMLYSLNCTSAQTFAGVETFFDNVIVNQ
jgi:hypothetical protein